MFADLFLIIVYGFLKINSVLDFGFGHFGIHHRGDRDISCRTVSSVCIKDGIADRCVSQYIIFLWRFHTLHQWYRPNRNRVFIHIQKKSFQHGFLNSLVQYLRSIVFLTAKAYHPSFEFNFYSRFTFLTICTGTQTASHSL